MSDSGLKVTDRRMFTPEGELREAYLRRQSADETPSSDEERARPAQDAPAEPAPGFQAEAAPAPSPPAAPPEAPEAEQPPEDERPGAPRFADLVRLLAENASIYLSEAQGGDPQTAQQHLELARLHIDMLGILQDKTRGNLTSNEHAMLENVIYQLRSGFVGLGG